MVVEGGREGNRLSCRLASRREVKPRQEKDILVSIADCRPCVHNTRISFLAHHTIYLSDYNSGLSRAEVNNTRINNSRMEFHDFGEFPCALLKRTSWTSKLVNTAIYRPKDHKDRRKAWEKWSRTSFLPFRCASVSLDMAVVTFRPVVIGLRPSSLFLANFLLLRSFYECE